MGQLFSDFFLFIYTILSYWQAYATGGLITMAVGLFERLSNHQLTKRAYVGLFVITFLFASFFLAWRDEHNNYLRTSEELQKIKSPILTGEIMTSAVIAPTVGGSLTETEKITDNDTVLMLVVRIKNQGAPTILDNWRLTVTYPGMAPKEAILLTPPPGTMLGPKPADLTFSSADFLPDKTITNPIPTGGAVTGNLMFLVRGISPAAPIEVVKGAQLDLYFKDVGGSEKHIHAEFAGKLDKSIAIPGLKRP
jgi:hypothetical protein